MAKITSFRTVDAATGYQVGTVHLESFQKGKSAALENKRSLKWNKPLNFLCQWCDQRFTGSRFQMFCGNSCRSRAYHSQKTHYWTQEELDYLAGMISTYSYSQIITKFRNKFGYTAKQISDRQLQNRLSAIAKSEGLRSRDRDDNLSMKQWSELFGISMTAFDNWVAKYIKHQKVSPTLTTIKRSDIKAFALSDPLWFDDIQPDNLLWFFDGDIKPLINAAKLAVAEHRWGPRKRREVFCVETQQMFNSVRDAGKHCGLSITTMANRIESEQAVWLPVGARSSEKAPFHFQYYFNLVHGWGKKYA